MPSKKGIKRGDLCWAKLPKVGGPVQHCRRPVLIVQNDIGNKHAATVIAVVITSKLSQRPNPTSVRLPGRLLPKPSEAKCSQIVTLDKELHLAGRIASVPVHVVDQVDQALRISLAL